LAVRAGEGAPVRLRSHHRAAAFTRDLLDHASKIRSMPPGVKVALPSPDFVAKNRVPVQARDDQGGAPRIQQRTPRPVTVPHAACEPAIMFHNLEDENACCVSFGP
jgi:hypothetical protein